MAKVKLSQLIKDIDAAIKANGVERVIGTLAAKYSLDPRAARYVNAVDKAFQSGMARGGTRATMGVMRIVRVASWLSILSFAVDIDYSEAGGASLKIHPAIAELVTFVRALILAIRDGTEVPPFPSAKFLVALFDDAEWKAINDMFDRPGMRGGSVVVGASQVSSAVQLFSKSTDDKSLARRKDSLRDVMRCIPMNVSRAPRFMSELFDTLRAHGVAVPSDVEQRFHETAIALEAEAS